METNTNDGDIGSVFLLNNSRFACVLLQQTTIHSQQVHFFRSAASAATAVTNGTLKHIKGWKIALFGGKTASRGEERREGGL